MNFGNISIYPFDEDFAFTEKESPGYILVDLADEVFVSYLDTLIRIRSKYPFTNISLLYQATEQDLKISIQKRLKILNFIANDTENWQTEVENDLIFIRNQHYLKKTIGGN